MSRSVQSSVWALARQQHDVVARWQLLDLGFSARAIAHRIARGRLHRVGQGVYVIGRPRPTRHGAWMAAVLACGPEAALSHESAAELWRIRQPRQRLSDVSVPHHVRRRRPGIRLHRRTAFEVTRHEGIPVTTPTCTLIDLAGSGDRDVTEAAVNQADALDLIDPERLRAELERHVNRPGVPALKQLLDRHTFVATESWLERHFVPLALNAGLPLPQGQRRLHGHRVDFLWPDLGLVVETDSLRYHRTAAKQTKDLRRDHDHFAAGLVPLRFSHAQIKYEPGHVEATLRSAARRLMAA